MWFNMGRGNAELEGCLRCIQILVLVFNFIFFVFGVAMLAYGIYTFIEIGDYASLSSVDFVSGSKLLIAVGVLISLVAFLGCCGAWKLKKWMLAFFILLLIIIFCCEIAAVVTGYMYRNKFKEVVDKDMQDFFVNQYGQSDKDGVTKAIDALQRTGDCCGFRNGSKDWQVTRWGQSRQTDVPDSCCKTETKDCGMDAIKKLTGKVSADVYDEPCKKKLEELVDKYLPVIGGIAIGILVIQSLGMTFAAILLMNIRKGTYA